MRGRVKKVIILRRHAPKLDGARLISRKTELIVDATDGNESLTGPGWIFTGFAEPKSASWAVFASRQPTPPTPAAVYELVEDRSIQAMCCGNPTKFCFESFLQVKVFCALHRNWLRGDFATIFPFHVGGEFFFADAYVLDDGVIELNTDKFDFPGIWAARYQPRIVVPVTH